MNAQVPDGVTLELPCSYPGARPPKKVDGRSRPAATTWPGPVDALRLRPPTGHPADLEDLAVDRADAILFRRGYPGAYPGATL